MNSNELKLPHPPRFKSSQKMVEPKVEFYSGLSLQSEYRNNDHAPDSASEDSHSGSGDDDGRPEGSNKRKRPMNVTCEACKQRKVKCDRAQPACGWCTRNDVHCIYKERKKPGLRAGYGRELETRIDQLEALVKDQTRQLAAHLAEACTLAGPSTKTTTSGTSQKAQSNTNYDDPGTINFAIDTPFQAPTIDPALRTSVSRHDSVPYATGAHSMANVSMGNPARQYTPSVHSHALTSPLSTVGYQPPQQVYHEQATLLPPYDLLYTLVDLYFRHVNVWLPLLDRKTTLDTLFGASPLEEADRILLYAIVATTLRFSRDPRLTPESRQHYHDTSKQRVQLYGLENSNVRALQALVVLALDVTGSSNGPPGWNILALISRSMVQLGLSVETISPLTAPMYPSIATLRAAALPEAKTWIEDEERRRVFWSVYLLDRYATIATAFEFALDEKEIDRRLPCRDDHFAANKHVETRWFRPIEKPRYNTVMADAHGHFSYHCELMGILGQVHQFLKRPIDIGSLVDVEQWQASYRALDSELNGWHFNLPDEFANITRMIRSNVPAKNASVGWIMLHAAYCLTVIRLNSSAAYPSQSSLIFSSSYSAMQRCLSAVDNMRQLGHFVRISGLTDKLGPPFAFSAWVCARVMLVHGSTMDHEVDPDMGFFVTMLSEMGQYWDVAQRYSDILNRVLEEYRQSRRSGGISGERVTPSAVRILADMRRCAYDLDLLISRQPHTSQKSYHPTRANTPAPNEMEYLDVFDLFNFPRMPVSTDQVDGVDATELDQGVSAAMAGVNSIMGMPNFAVPNPETDWLFQSS